MKRKESQVVFLFLLLSLFFINVKPAKALTFNTATENLWGGWPAKGGTSIKNSSAIKWSCKKISDPNNLLVISTSNGCALSSKDVYNNYTAKIEISRTMSGKTTSVQKEIKMKANAASVKIKVGEEVDAGQVFKQLGLMAFNGCGNFTATPTNILAKGECNSYKFKAKALASGSGLLQVKSLSGINFRYYVSVASNSSESVDSTNATLKNIEVNVNEEATLTSDTDLCSFSSKSSVKTSGAAKLYSSGHKCIFKSNAAGTYTAYDKSKGILYKYTITVTGGQSGSNQETPPKQQPVLPATKTWNYEFYNWDSENAIYTESKNSSSAPVVDLSKYDHLLAAREGYEFTGWLEGKWNNGVCTEGKKENWTLQGTSGTQFSACWKKIGASNEPINKHRYVNITDTSLGFTCGDQVYITECNLDTNACTFTEYNGKEYSINGAAGSIPRTLLVESKPACATLKENVIQFTTNNPFSENFNDEYRFVEGEGNASATVEQMNCGDRVKLTDCQEGNSPGTLCRISSINGVPVTGQQVYRMRLRPKEEGEPVCDSIKRYSQQGATYYVAPNSIPSESKNDPNALQLTCNSELIFDELPYKACTYGPVIPSSEGAHQYCKVKNKETDQHIYVDRTKIGRNQSVCTGGVCEPKDKQLNQEKFAPEQISICYDIKNGEKTVNGYDSNEIFKCSDKYWTNIIPDESNNTCVDRDENATSCYQTYFYSCSSKERPYITGYGGKVNPLNNRGTIGFTVKDSSTGKGIKGYIVNNGASPTVASNYTSFNNTDYTATIGDLEVKSYWVWAMTNDNAISRALVVKVHDDDISTTASDLYLKTDRGHETLRSLDGDSLTYNSGIVSSDYVRLSNNLITDSKLAVGFDLFTTAYEVDVTSDKVAVFATLTSDDSSYAPGYEPRTVSLDYGRNVIEVKIINNNGKSRTYTFIVNRTDSRENENILSDLKISKGKINFDSYVSDYTISVPKRTSSVNINGTIASTNAKFVAGFEPRKVNLDNDITSAIIKVASEAGSVRSYVLTFVKKGTEETESLENSVYLDSLTISGATIDFNRDITDYTVSVDYETEMIEVYALTESSKATVELNGNAGLKVGTNKVEIIVRNGQKSKVYNLYVNRKEDGLGVSSSTHLETLTVKGYDLQFYEDVYDYTVKIKREKTLLLTATPQSNRSNVFMYGNNDLTGFSTVRVKVIAEDGQTGLYSINIVKDAFNRSLETTISVVGGIIILGGAIIIMIRKKRKAHKEYIEG